MIPRFEFGCFYYNRNRRANQSFFKKKKTGNAGQVFLAKRFVVDAEQIHQAVEAALKQGKDTRRGAVFVRHVEQGDGHIENGIKRGSHRVILLYCFIEKKPVARLCWLLRVFNFVCERTDRIGQFFAGCIVFGNYAENTEDAIQKLHEAAENALKLVKKLCHWNQSSVTLYFEKFVSLKYILTYCKEKDKDMKEKSFVLFVNFLSRLYGNDDTIAKRNSRLPGCFGANLFVECAFDRIDQIVDVAFVAVSLVCVVLVDHADVSQQRLNKGDERVEQLYDLIKIHV